MNLHNEIMNIPCDFSRGEFANEVAYLHYKEGHRDARHAAAELALQAATTYTVNGEVMSPLEYIDYLHSQLSDCMSETAKQAALAGLNSQDTERYRWLRAQPCNISDTPRIDVVYWTCEGDDSVNEGEGLRMEALDAAIDKELGK